VIRSRAFVHLSKAHIGAPIDAVRAAESAAIPCVASRMRGARLACELGDGIATQRIATRSAAMHARCRRTSDSQMRSVGSDPTRGEHGGFASSRVLHVLAESQPLWGAWRRGECGWHAPCNGDPAPVLACHRGPAVSGILFYLAIAFAVSCSFGWLTRAARRVSVHAEARTHSCTEIDLTWLQ